MNVLFTYRAFDNVAGGVQKTSTDLMNEMVRRGHNISLLTWDKSGATSYFPLDTSIKWHKIGIGDYCQTASWKTRFKRMAHVRKIVGKIRPDLIIGYQDGMFVAMRLFTVGMRIPVIAAERNAPGRYKYTKAGKYKNLVFQLFRLASRITIQCPSYRNEYPAFLRRKIVTIPNPIYSAPCQAFPSGTVGERKILLSVGRLGFQKNYQALVKAFITVASQAQDWTLIIVGEGEDREDLETLIAEAGISSRILLPGTSKEVSSWYCRSHLFCLPSRWEGFPNALGEAMAHGLPSVGFNACPGVRDLIGQGKTGLLAEGEDDHESLSRQLLLLMQDDKLRVHMGETAKAETARYAPQEIFNQWEKLFQDIIR